MDLGRRSVGYLFNYNERLTMFDIKDRVGLEKICGNIKHYLWQHHKIYDLPVQSEYWENLLAKALNSCNIENSWTPDLNHKQGLDMVIENALRVSCKTGQIIGGAQNNLSFSGSRMTKHKTLQDKLNFLSNKRDDVYMLLSRSKEEWENGQKKYYFIVFPSDMLQYEKMNWIDTVAIRGKSKGELSGHKASSKVFDATIRYPMSHQLWTVIKNYKDNEEVFVREISV